MQRSADQVRAEEPSRGRRTISQLAALARAQRRTVARCWRPNPLTMHLARVVYLAEQHPTRAVESCLRKLLHRLKVGGTRIDDYSWRQQWKMQGMWVRGRPHYVFTRESVVA